MIKLFILRLLISFFNYQLSELHPLCFKTEEQNVDNYQDNAVINYTNAETPYTWIIKHKYFEFGKGDYIKTIITKEYPVEWHHGDKPYYPVNNKKNNDLYQKYILLAEKTNA